MEIYFFIVPVGIIFFFIAVRALLWAIKSGQYENLETEAHRILFEEDEVTPRKPSTDIKNTTHDAPSKEGPR